MPRRERGITGLEGFEGPRDSQTMTAARVISQNSTTKGNMKI
jgi:hypothetical protein